MANSGSMGNGGWIKLHRNIENWEWWDDEKMVKFFIHAIFKASTADRVWQGVQIPRGSFISSYQKLAAECNFSIKQIRGMVDKLIRTGEMAKCSAPKYTMFTVKNYTSYQAEGTQKGTQRAGNRANEGQTEGKQRATVEELENYKNYEKEKESADADFCPTDNENDGYDDKPWIKNGFDNEADYIRWLKE